MNLEKQLHAVTAFLMLIKKKKKIKYVIPKQI